MCLIWDKWGLNRGRSKAKDVETLSGKGCETNEVFYDKHRKADQALIDKGRKPNETLSNEGGMIDETFKRPGIQV